MIRIVLVALAIATTGCAPVGDTTPPPPGGRESITYSTGPCFGSCPVYSVTVASDGTGTFTGTRFTAVTGEQPFTLKADEYRAFAASLMPHLPASGVTRYAQGESNCRQAPTDMPSAQVRRTTSQGEVGIDFYYGCASENRAIADALRAAPDKLPIAAMIGDRSAFIGKR